MFPKLSHFDDFTVAPTRFGDTAGHLFNRISVLPLVDLNIDFGVILDTLASNIDP